MPLGLVHTAAATGGPLSTNSTISKAWALTPSGFHPLVVSIKTSVKQDQAHIPVNIDYATHWGWGYHGYWVIDQTKLNAHFGDGDDLAALVTALHDRDMLLMVDIVVNDVAATSTSTYTSTSALQSGGYLFTEEEYYHPLCWVDENNQTSAEDCWMGDSNVPLMDVNTENSYVISTYETWISELVSNYSIDGLRLDAARNVRAAFWPGFCSAAGVFCIGEVFSGSTSSVAEYQTGGYLDATLNYPWYYALTNAFSPTKSMSSLISYVSQITSEFSNTAVLGNFLENQDNTRFRNVTTDAQQAYNALVGQFLFDGIPIVYYGQEQEISFGSTDPYNRNALWEVGYGTTTTSKYMTTLNKIRSALVSSSCAQLNCSSSYLDDKSTVISSTSNDVAIRKGPIIISLTNRGASASSATFSITGTTWSGGVAIVDLLSCSTGTTNSDGSISVTYSSAAGYGRPYVFALAADAASLGLCSTSTTASSTTVQSTSTSTSAKTTTTATSASTTSAAAASCTAVAVTFNEVVTTTYGETIKISGNATALGSWDTSKAITLSAANYTSSDHLWHVTVNLTPGSTVLYKFINEAVDGTISWESDPNRSFTVTSGCTGETVGDTWR